MRFSRHVVVAALLLVAMAVPLFASVATGSTDPQAHTQTHGANTEGIDEGLEAGDSGEAVAALQEYLEAFGYMHGRTYQTRTFDSATEAALEDFQRIFGLEVSGRVDHATYELLRTPRFDDMPDVAANGDPQLDPFVLFGASWDDPNLTYAYGPFTSDLSQAAQKAAMQQAFATWAAVTPLTFTEVASNQNPEIVISFVTGNHGDGAQNAFDGAGGVLAHAFYPPETDPASPTLHGDAHFDDAETWTVTIPVPFNGIDLVTVAIHEFGHSLGLGHSNNNNAIMAPFYTGANRTLHSDDIAGIQAHYGSGGGASTVDAEVLSISMSPASTTVGNPVSGTVQVRNNGNQAATIPVTVTGPSNFTHNMTTGSLNSGATTSLDFNWTPTSTGNFTLTATANLSGDQTTSNNSKTSNNVNVSNPQLTVDAETVNASASPTSITQNSGNVTITATVRNNGSAQVTIPVTASGPNNWSSSTTRTLAPSASSTVQFTWPASVVGAHTFTVSTSLSGDQSASNDSKTTNSVTVSSPPSGGTIFVNGVNLSATPSGNGHNLQAVITIGPNASAGSGAYMYGFWIDSQNKSKFAYGFANGNGQLTLNTTTTLSGVHKFQVYYVNKTGMTYNAGQNVGNPGSVNVGGGSQPVIDASVNAVSASPTSIALNGGNVTITATIGNNGDNTASIPVSISGPGGFNSSQNINVSSGNTAQVTFNWPASVAGNHTFTVTTNLAGDSSAANNQRTSQTVTVTQTTVIDAEVVSLSRSTSSVQQNGPTVSFTANVRNNGTGSATFTVRLTSGSAGVNTTQSVTLNSGASQNVTFQWNPTVVGLHSFTATAELTGDSNAGNNSKSTTLDVTQPQGGNQVFVDRFHVIKVFNYWLVYTYLDTSNGQAASGATVTATLQASSGQTRQHTATTGAGGYTFMYVTPVGTGSHTFTVNNISLSGYSYNPALNGQTSMTLP